MTRNQDAQSTGPVLIKSITFSNESYTRATWKGAGEGATWTVWGGHRRLAGQEGMEAEPMQRPHWKTTLKILSVVDHKVINKWRWHRARRTLSGRL